MRKILHIDMDAFYASVEQRDDPALRGKPVAVGYAEQRGVVAAASYEARTFGVRSAMPSSTARRNCPELIFVAPRFGVYRQISDQIRQIFATFTPLIEPLSLDEAYLDLTDHLRAQQTAWITATQIRAAILQQTGLTASAGVSYNKFLAKLASGWKKPNGQFAVLPEQGADFVQELPVSRFHGIGPKTARKMNDLGIHLGADLRAQSKQFLLDQFGKVGDWYYSIARGEDDRPVLNNRPRKSSGSETTFGQDLFDCPSLEKAVQAMADGVWQWCERSGQFGRTVTLKIKFGDFRVLTRSRTGSDAVNDQAMLRQISMDLLHSIFPLQTGIRLVGVTVSNFRPHLSGGLRQLDLAF